MDMMEAIKARHSVRQYEDRTIPVETREQLLAEIDTINKESGLHIQILFSLQGDKVTAAAGRGFYTAMDLGIVRYHFEAVTGRTVG